MLFTDTVAYINSLNSNDLIALLFEFNLINAEVECDVCNLDMVIKKNNNKLGSNWRCMQYGCMNYQTTKSLLNNSFFKKFPNIKKTLLVLYHISIGIKVTNIKQLTNTGRHQITAIKKAIILKIKSYFKISPIKLGGPGKIIHVDETKLNHNVRAHRGRGPRLQLGH